MSHRKTSKRSKAKTMLRFADLEQSKNAVLHSLGAASSQESRSQLKADSPSNSLDVSHIGAKDFRYGHGSIGVLVLFDDRDQHSGARNRRVVQRITKT